MIVGGEGDGDDRGDYDELEAFISPSSCRACRSAPIGCTLEGAGEGPKRAPEQRAGEGSDHPRGPQP